MTESNYDIGMIGLGTMGCNLALNMADHGFSAVGFDVDPAKVASFQKQASDKPVLATVDLGAFVAALKLPRKVMLLVPAGKPVDAVLNDIVPLLNPGDIVMDGGNSHFTETDRRQKALAEKGLFFMGIGVSGGEEGARNGPCMMPGGPREAYPAVQPILEASAAKVKGEPCVAYLGPGSAGHYVKMVHNGIEYGLMQLISETYDLMKRGVNFNDDDLAQVYREWNAEEMNSFLLEITADIFLQRDEKTDQRLIDLIRDEAKQKGTGMWASQDAMQLQVPIPTIDAAVMMRDLSGYKSQRLSASQVLKGPAQPIQVDRSTLLTQIKQALHVGMILTYTQGLSLLAIASQQYGYQLNLREIARIWRGGCIIRSAMLETMMQAYQTRPDLSLLLLDPVFAEALSYQHADLRSVIRFAVGMGIPVPGMMACLGYYDAFRSTWLPTNLIQAQRDYFGAHTYERVDETGTFHTHWQHLAESMAYGNG